MEEIPTYRVNSYYHAALRSHDIWTVKEQPPVEVQIDHLLEFAKMASVDMTEEG